MTYINDSKGFNHPNAIIYNKTVVQEIIKKSGMRFRLVAQPSDKVTEKLIQTKDAFKRYKLIKFHS